VPAAVGETLCIPDVACVPLQAPDASQVVTLVVDQVSDAVAPSVMGLGDTDNEAVGGMLITVESLADAEPVIPPPDTLTWFTCGEVALAATFTVTVIPG